MNQQIEFADIVQLNVNNKNYYIQKNVLINTLDYFKTMFSTKIPTSDIISLDIDPKIDFNIILNILMFNFCEKQYDLIKSYICDEFIEIINILMFFGANMSIVSNLIIMYTNNHDIPFEMLLKLGLNGNNINNALKKSIINKITNIISSTPIIIPKELIYNEFKIIFEDNDINFIKEQLSIKLFTTYNNKLTEINVPEFVHKQVSKNKSIYGESLQRWDTGINILNNIINENGFASIIHKNIITKIDGYDVNISIDNNILISHKCGFIPTMEKYKIFDIIADYLVRNKILHLFHNSFVQIPNKNGLIIV